MRGRVFFGRYEIQRLLGEGGMGKVYLARQTDLNRPVVLKVMHEHVAADPAFQDRFQREMLLMARFQHPYAVTLYDAVANDAEGPCIIMEYVRGETLATVLMRNNVLSPYRVGRLLGQICEVLQEAHAQGIIHRDLTPSNLMVLDADTPYEKIKVMDFGLAKLLEGQALKRSGDSGADHIVGTPAYMCPEQARGEEMDHRGDIYSMGVILYELLTGTLPFRGLSTMDTLLAHAVDQPPAMSEGGVYVPPAIEAVVMQCLAKKAEERPGGARDLAQFFDNALRASDPSAEMLDIPEVEETEDQPPPVPEKLDPTAFVYQVQAWMPESVAAYKLRGFIQDAGGQVLESVPGRIKVMLGGPGSMYEAPRNGLSWFGLGAKQGIEMELHLAAATGSKQNYLWVTVILRHQGRQLDRNWRPQCDQIFRDLRGYLIGSSAAMPKV